MTGGFARSVVNDDAGAETPAAGILPAVGILLAALLLTPFLYFLPQATLPRQSSSPCSRWSISTPDADVELLAQRLSPPWRDTILATFVMGVETGIVTA